MRLFWTETAKQDLQAIRRYIASDNPTAAKRWVDRLKTRARNALIAPLAGRKVPELLREDIRELIEGNYRIFYYEKTTKPNLGQIQIGPLNFVNISIFFNRFNGTQ